VRMADLRASPVQAWTGAVLAAVLCPWPWLYSGKFACGRTARNLTIEITVDL